METYAHADAHFTTYVLLSITFHDFFFLVFFKRV